MSVISGIVILLVFSIVCYAVGCLIQSILHQQGKGAAHAFVTGSFALLFLFFLLQIAVVGLSLPFSVLQWGYVGVCTTLFLVAALVVRGALWSGPVESIRRTAGEKDRLVLWLLVVLLFCFNVILIEIGTPYFGNDMSVEQAATTLATRTLYRYHPATGEELVHGVARIAKCNALPQLYAVLCACSGADVYTLICSLIPVWGLLLNLAACSVFAGAWGIAGSMRQRLLVFYLFLILVGSYYDGAYAFRLLYQGFSLHVIFLATGGMAFLAMLISLVRGRAKGVKGGKADA